MFRIEFTKTSDGHEDIVLFIGEFKQIADSYYFADFFNLNISEVENLSQHIWTQYLSYLEREILSLSSEKKFIVFDLADQYIGGFLAYVDEEGNYILNYVSTNEITGWSTGIDHLTEVNIESTDSLRSDGTWKFSKTEIKRGLATSLGSANNPGTN